MRKRKKVILGVAVGSWLAIACGSGSGALISLDDGYDRPADLRENPGAGREAPGAGGYEAPPPSGDNPGSQGGGGGGAACPPCDVKLACTGGPEGADSVKLKTVNGQCSAGDGVILDCNGKIVLNGTQIGTWRPEGGGYVVNTSLKGQSLTETCRISPSTTDPPPRPTGGPATPPPVDAGIPDGLSDAAVFDAATGG